MSDMVSISDLVQASLDLTDLDPEEWQRKWARRLIGGAKAAAEGNTRRDIAIQHLLKATDAGQDYASEVLVALQDSKTRGAQKMRLRQATAKYSETSRLYFGIAQIVLRGAVPTKDIAGKSAEELAAVLEFPKGEGA